MSPEGQNRNDLRFGVFVPQGWKLEYTGWDARAAWERSVEFAKSAERAGYDHLWVYDHFETVPRREPSHCFEPYTMLSALSQHTERVKLGQLVTCVGYRNVGHLAKQTACLDVMSDGRVILGIGAGWYDREYEAYGYEYPSDGVRLDILSEALEVIPRLWTEETVSYDGKHLHLAGAYCDPKPTQHLPEIWVGGGGERKTLRIAARHADATNWQVGIDGFKRKSRLLEQYCDEIGRPFGEIRRTHGPDCRIFDTEAEARAWCEEPSGGNIWDRMPADEYLRENLVGTVEQVAEKTQAFVDAGCTDFVLWMRDTPSDESTRRFVEDVVPELTAP